MVKHESRVPLDRRYILAQDIDPQFADSFTNEAPAHLRFPTRNHYAFLHGVMGIDPKTERVKVETSQEWIILEKRRDNNLLTERALNSAEKECFITAAATVDGDSKRGKKPTIDEAIVLLRRKFYEIEPETLQRQLGEDGESASLGDLMRAGDNTEDEAVGNVLAEDVASLLLRVEDPRDRRVLSLRFGFEGRPYTLEEVGREMGFTRERARQLQIRGLRALVSNPRARELFSQYVSDNE